MVGRVIPDDPHPSNRPGGYRRLARVTVNEQLGAHAWLTLEVPGWRGARPGQFALLQPEPSQCFLPRALSIADDLGQHLSFLVAPVGVGTLELAQLSRGDGVWLLGPLGNGFDMPALAAGPGRIVLVAGGAGIAPFPAILRWIGDRYREASVEADVPPRTDVLVLLGFRDALQAEALGPVQQAAVALQQTGAECRLEVATEDGSVGAAEKATDLLRRFIEPGDRVASCGPLAMAEEVWRICSAMERVRAWFSLEADMACGIGSCHGCAIQLADGSSARVCHEGPVFRGEEVFGG